MLLGPVGDNPQAKTSTVPLSDQNEQPPSSHQNDSVASLHRLKDSTAHLSVDSIVVPPLGRQRSRNHRTSIGVAACKQPV
jgi:hypothetical protein